MTPTPAPATQMDVNNAGCIRILATLMMAQSYVGRNPQGFTAARADVNCEGSITIVDALRPASVLCRPAQQFLSDPRLK